MKVWFQNRRTKNKREVTDGEDGQPRSDGGSGSNNSGTSGETSRQHLDEEELDIIDYDDDDEYVEQLKIQHAAALATSNNEVASTMAAGSLNLPPVGAMSVVSEAHDNTKHFPQDSIASKVSEAATSSYNLGSPLSPPTAAVNLSVSSAAALRQSAALSLSQQPQVGLAAAHQAAAFSLSARSLWTQIPKSNSSNEHP